MGTGLLGCGDWAGPQTAQEGRKGFQKGSQKGSQTTPKKLQRCQGAPWLPTASGDVTSSEHQGSPERGD
eukprot:3985850-Pyramimonas_sp.AAC.1